MGLKLTTVSEIVAELKTRLQESIECSNSLKNLVTKDTRDNRFYSLVDRANDLSHQDRLQITLKCLLVLIEVRE